MAATPPSRDQTAALARRDLAVGAALAASWVAIWCLYSAYTWTTDPSSVTVQVVRFYVPAIGAIALLGAWLVTRIPGRARMVAVHHDRRDCRDVLPWRLVVLRHVQRFWRAAKQIAIETRLDRPPSPASDFRAASPRSGRTTTAARTEFVSVGGAWNGSSDPVSAGRKGKCHLTRIDRADPLTGDIPDLLWLSRFDGESVKDVRLLIALDLRNGADEDAVCRDDVRSLLNLKPRDRVCHWRPSYHGNKPRDRSRRPCSELDVVCANESHRRMRRGPPADRVKIRSML